MRMTLLYHWRKLPQVSFLSRQTRVCRDKGRVLSKMCRDKHKCRDKIMQLFLSRQKFCHDRHVFAATNIILSIRADISRSLSDLRI